ncbi:hypothetical protein T484DRAFT_1967599 [Baffinella frigidus]|nr:hypothetical protein T484DRAFT_1967599 [Cryptophyta sp. CCMP2293]
MSARSVPCLLAAKPQRALPPCLIKDHLKTPQTPPQIPHLVPAKPQPWSPLPASCVCLGQPAPHLGGAAARKSRVLQSGMHRRPRLASPGRCSVINTAGTRL